MALLIVLFTVALISGCVVAVLLDGNMGEDWFFSSLFIFVFLICAFGFASLVLQDSADPEFKLESKQKLAQVTSSQKPSERFTLTSGWEDDGNQYYYTYKATKTGFEALKFEVGQSIVRYDVETPYVETFEDVRAETTWWYSSALDRYVIHVPRDTVLKTGSPTEN